MARLRRFFGYALFVLLANSLLLLRDEINNIISNSSNISRTYFRLGDNSVVSKAPVENSTVNSFKDRPISASRNGSPDETKKFPADWLTTNASISALKKVQSDIYDTYCHGASHVLFDLRSTFGTRPVKYLEIGSYTGVSAALMLSHPLKTFVTVVDPCILPASHFQGELSHELFLKKKFRSISPPEECPSKNLWMLNVGFSPEALPTNETFDIIFINGDHSTKGVWADYKNTVNLLRPGGFMVFDGYLDHKASVMVASVVDDIARVSELIPIGPLKNVHNIHPEINQSFINEYIFQKRGRFSYAPQTLFFEIPTLCIVLPTHQAQDGSTPFKLDKMWKMLEKQTYTKWKLYISGDCYSNISEWESISFMKNLRVSAFNLLEPGERGKLSGLELWHMGGATARNNAIQRAVSDGYEWVVLLDDDDLWDSDHLTNIVSGVRIGATFVMTSSYWEGFLFPPESYHVTSIHNLSPKSCQIVHASAAFNAAKLYSRYQQYPTIPDMAGKPDDAFLFDRIVFDELFYPAFVPIPSVHYFDRGRNPIVHRRSALKFVPDGWVGESNQDEYSVLAALEFPANLSQHCQFVVGPSEPMYGFRATQKSPYFISNIPEFHGLPVWLNSKGPFSPYY